jgi:type IV pilus assembly protein PilV
MNIIKGFTLVELMVAILVLAIGLLGLAALQVVGLSSNHNAYLRTQATFLAQDMADRMRNNRASLAAYVGAAAGATDCSSSTCTSAQMVGYDIAQWNAALATQLPGGVGTVTVTVNGAVYRIRVIWSEHEDTQDPNNVVVQKQFDMSFQP